ncbi:prealbumin-like fold domain-containing protein [Sinomonas sp. ASV322]|uniref:MSCRAMM family protein n=1 Tax=Sinomonas sp. ASV322 TaxID=3041920 RepID=UPI0027DAE493|nr:prealbumin-like fold domain-containing protein [Sinomonas sp. ASV322]MDQ4503186.1 prealbumin-like fold domain-containing protein [Sinomonas sp. ASV322]
MKLIRRTRWGALLGVGALVLSIAAPAQADTLKGSPFDAGNGSLTTNVAGEIDWTTPSFGVNCTDVTFTHFCRDDLPSGKNDNSFGNGTKEDDQSPTVVTGAIPPNKSDLTRFFAKVETESNGQDYAYLAWERQNNPSGTTNMDFELNQSATVDANGIPVRTDGDVLMDFHLANGGTSPTIISYRWNAATGSCQAATAPPCWGPGTTITNSGGQILDTFQASVNTAVGQANDPFPGTVLTTAPGALDPFTFGEAAVNLELANIIPANSCFTLNNAYLKSRSSDSFTSEIKDFILPIHLGFQKCGSIIIQKKTIGGVGTFNYTDTSTATVIPGSFSLTTATAGTPVGTTIMPVNSTDPKALRAGTYTFTEGAKTGFDLTGLSCSSANGTSSTSTSGATATVNLTPGDTVTCLYVNTARAALHVKKVTNPNPDTTNASFGFTGPNNDSASLMNGQTFDRTNLLPGSYVWTETAKTGWDLTNVACGTGGTGSVANRTATFSLTPGSDVTCTFTNTQRGTITIHKQDDANPAVPLAGAVFTLLDPQGNPLPAGTADSLTCMTNASGNCSFTDVLPGSYLVRETTTPPGFTTAADQFVTVAPGATVTLTFTNPRQFTIIVLVCKNADSSLYPSQVTVDGSTLTSLGAAPAGLTSAQLCSLGGASFSPKAVGSHPASVLIPQ